MPKGALIGPMVIAAVSIDKKNEKKLVQIGVKDSKELSSKRREILAEQIERIAKNIVVLKVPACKIDSYRARKINLDKIEAMKIAELIQMIEADTIYIDSLETPKRFEPLILSFTTNPLFNLVVENYADETYPVVSAASIIAKVERDKAIEELKKKVGYDFGVGYSHDERTIKFLESILQNYKAPPPFIRWNWETVHTSATKLFNDGKNIQPWVKTEILKQESWQKKLKDFIFGKREKCK